MRPIKHLKSDDPAVIFCVGDNTSVMKFEIGFMNWMKIPVDNDKQSREAWDGTLRYGSVCYCPPCPEEKLIFTGGCFTINGFPASVCTEFKVAQLKKAKKKRPMLLKRYGHISVYLNGLVYCIGGFSHKDLPNEQPVTLSACERFSVNTECQWTHVSSMCEARAFASFVTFNSQYIYVFGGMHDYQVLQSVEKYDTLADTWNKMYFKLPKPIAKLGSVLATDNTIIIAGGMSKDFEPSAEVWELDLTKLEWREIMPMFSPRLTASGLFLSQIEDNHYIYAIGGNKSRDCERYDLMTEAWETIPSFREKVDQDPGGGSNCLFTYSMACSNFL